MAKSVIPAKAGIQKSTGFRVKPGMTNCIRLMSSCMAPGIIIFILMLTGIFSSEGLAQKPMPGGPLTIALSAEPPGLDPTTNPAATIKRVVTYHLFDSLLKVNRKGGVVLALAKGYEVSKDGKQYTFHLPGGVKFHDGKPLTAEDVKYSFERLLDPKTAAPNRKYYEGIESIEAVNPLNIKFKVKKYDYDR